MKAFVAAMLALYCALALGLPRPYWAMATVYVVSHPLSGATRSKGVYRALGTLLGAAGSVVIVPTLGSEPVLFSLVLALWTGLLMYFALLDRTPRSYLYMLAAYSLGLIALPAITTPEQIFDIAIARSEEILLGILCASVVSAVVFPTRILPLLQAKLNAWLKDAAGWAGAILSAADGAQAAKAFTRHQLASDILALDQFILQLSYDTINTRLVAHTRGLRDRLAMLLPILSSLSVTLTELRQQANGVPTEEAQLMQSVANWLAAPSDPAMQETGRALLQQLSEPASTTAPIEASRAALLGHLRARMHALVSLWLDCQMLRDTIGQQLPQPPAPFHFNRWEVGSQARHHDFGIVTFSATSVCLAIFLCCLGWMWMGWNDSGSLVSMAAIASCFFSALDEPARAQKSFFIWNALLIVVAAVLLFLIIPLAHEYETLVMCLMAPFILGGLLATRPQFTMIAMTLTVAMASVMGLSGAYNADFPSYFNMSLASVVGILYALLWTLVTRPFGAKLAMRRLVHASWDDLARMAAGQHSDDHAVLQARMLDRLGQLVPRLSASGDDKPTDGFSELRVGFSVLDLQQDEAALGPAARASVQKVLEAVSRHYRDRLTQSPAGSRAESMGDLIQGALEQVHQDASEAATQAAHALVELRLSLVPPQAQSA